MSNLPKAVIFDLDGVITDTAEFHFLAWKQLGEELGIEVDRALNEQLKGVSRLQSLERIIASSPKQPVRPIDELERLAAKKNTHYTWLIQSISPNDILPGIDTLIKELRAASIKLAVGSASKNAPFVLERLELTGAFDYIVDASNIRHGKPDPETFTDAADYLKVPYKACIGIEDSAAGIEAIKRAGMFAVGIGSAESLHQADYLVRATDNLRMSTILEAYSQWSNGTCLD
ncbi:beta-phosphoglucomutase [Paenibacillus sp. FSL H7-0357]|uniref:beta-phosphoglucomutase n=1 Tax=Paenibacillus sp. FSL H7-0357 TaxID=1536774 RepID=UPI0004F71A83|nr:beta-phosphoglucomutase [Paenibacillus sp. FSL H7-0357]AIQ16621.1 beta-phosphoglucomutase [Paenibacillus sp. FSL H7-0357]